MTLVRFHLDSSDMRIIIDALRSSKGDRGATRDEKRIADDMQRDLDHHRESMLRQARLEAEEATRRAERARKHTLTPPQAEALYALHMGHSVYDKRDWLGWRRRRGMGGAARRMVEALAEEGLITYRPHKLTPEGAERLRGYIEKHPKFATYDQ